MSVLSQFNAAERLRQGTRHWITALLVIFIGAGAGIGIAAISPAATVIPPILFGLDHYLDEETGALSDLTAYEVSRYISLVAVYAAGVGIGMAIHASVTTPLPLGISGGDVLVVAIGILVVSGFAADIVFDPENGLRPSEVNGS